MNHLAHLFLAPDTELHRVGSLLGDFARGLNPMTLPEPVHEGLRHHRSVDAYTDQHPDVLASKRLFSARRRRFAGVALDVLYDHYLLRHWDLFSAIPVDEFIDQVYAELQNHREVMPEKMQKVTAQIVHHDWFRSYQEHDRIGFALDRVANRIRFTHAFHGIIEEIETQDSELESNFLSFFPDLQAHAQRCLRTD